MPGHNKQTPFSSEQGTPPPSPPPPDSGCGLFIAAFLDILGHRERLRAIDPVPPRREMCDELLAIAKQVVLLRRDIARYFERVGDAGTRLPLKNPAVAAVEGIDSLSQRVRVRQFADSVLITTPVVGSKRGLAPIADAWSILFLCAQIVLFTLAREYAVRGGVELGLCVTLPGDGDLYGTAPLHAYDLERTSASYPRVVIGTRFMRYLDVVEQQPFDDDTASAARGAARLVHELLFEDDDNLVALDFLAPRVVDSAEGIREELVAPARQFVHREAKRLEADPKLGPRYARLCQYFESRA